MSETVTPMSVEVPFKISVTDDQIDLLHKKLELVTFPDELQDAEWRYGAPLVDIKRLVARWKDGFDWRVEEAKLNDELPQFTRDIAVGGHGILNIHYVHKTIPLLFVHGWPDSFIAVRKILPLLVQTSEEGHFPSFHVVAFSLPGYAFSEGPKKSGFTATHYAEIGNKLMLALGYNEYVTQAGDGGRIITYKMAQQYGGKHVKAWHTNFPGGSAPTLTSHPLLFLRQLFRPYTAAEKAGIQRTQWYQKESIGYYVEHSTQPQTLGYSLSDSPVGLLAWIYEKLVNWTDDYPWTDDEILAWVSVYYFSRAGPTASLRIYFEVTHSEDRESVFGRVKNPPQIPMGASYFPKSVAIPPRSWVRTTGNLVFESEHSSGGHFAAYEKPNELVEDLRNMFGRKKGEAKGPAFGVVDGRNGFQPV
ncbi:alpha/beta-hydrolase [Dendrothele bispora CBS 962.96]|uniref:Alpha/beta-hydrolase n=1 Tax=Dendrothele bispora (strain CBS 962.96) TaxID=1314807 RepID=A0A4S8LRP4_DENBC|nr:alpha/beta-hydrolase [Dendrothele bispora CBS 962.96]